MDNKYQLAVTLEKTGIAWAVLECNNESIFLASGILGLAADSFLTDYVLDDNCFLQIELIKTIPNKHYAALTVSHGWHFYLSLDFDVAGLIWSYQFLGLYEKLGVLRPYNWAENY